MARLTQSSIGSQQDNAAIQTLYRPAKPLPFELREHCVIYLEEGSYSEALTLLASLLVASNTTLEDVPAFVAEPQLLAILATLTVLPRLTTRAESTEEILSSNQALEYLQHVLAIVGPLNAQLTSAFTFTNKRRSKRQSGVQYRPSDGFDNDRDGFHSGDDEPFANMAIAHDDSLWSCAENFWQIVGWAFVCSAKYPLRWERWKLWLELMLDVLETDFAERQCHVSENVTLQDSLAMQYLATATESARGERWRIMRAIFACGSTQDQAEFSEIFRGETKGPKKKDHDARKPRKRIDLDNDDFGDYYNEDDDDDDKDIESEPVTDEKPRSSTRTTRSITQTPVSGGRGSTEDSITTPSSSIEAYGGLDALALRRRCLLLLIHVASALPDHFTSVDEIFDLAAEKIKSLPLQVFAFFVLPTGPNLFPPASHSSLLKMLLIPLLARNAPRHEDAFVTQTILERHYLPFTASNTSYVDNAKVSLVLETLLRLLRDHDMLYYNDSLKHAIETGIRARESKTTGYVHKTKEEEEAEVWLGMSSKRLEAFLKSL